jgi:prepilin signal peptidase PulO-like enzyme (type II secretory pathway)
LVPALLLALSLWLFFLCAVIDAQISLLPDALTFPLIATAFLYAVASPPFAIFAPLIGAGFFSLQWIVSRGRAVGSGDILIGAAMGFLLLDWRLMLVALGISYILGASVAVVLLMKNTKKRGDHLPFVPYLAAGTLLTLLFGYQVLGLLGW